MEVKKVSAGEVIKLENDVIKIKFYDNAKVGIKESQEIFDARVSFELPSGPKQMVLADIRGNPDSSNEARDFTKSKEMTECTVALALLIGGFMSQVIGNLFLSFNKSTFPTKLFSDEEKAIEWLMSQRESQSE